jgi:hypothetical protein
LNFKIQRPPFTPFVQYLNVGRCDPVGKAVHYCALEPFVLLRRIANPLEALGNTPLKYSVALFSVVSTVPSR